MKKNIIIPILCIIFSVLCGIQSHDLIIGGSLLATSLLGAYYQSEGKRINYVIGLINCLLMAYVSFINHLYGLFIFNLLVFSPIQVFGFINWKNNTDKEDNVIVRTFTVKNSILICTICIIGSIIIGYLLNLINSQQLAFMDSTSNCINLCALILLSLRFREAWIIWLFNNIVDLAIWIIMFINKGPNSFMMLLVSIGYLTINIYGIIKWNKSLKHKK